MPSQYVVGKCENAGNQQETPREQKPRQPTARHQAGLLPASRHSHPHLVACALIRWQVAVITDGLPIRLAIGPRGAHPLRPTHGDADREDQEP